MTLLLLCFRKSWQALAIRAFIATDLHLLAN